MNKLNLQNQRVDTCKNTTSAKIRQNVLIEATPAKTRRQGPFRLLQNQRLFIYLPYIHHFKLKRMNVRPVFILRLDEFLKEVMTWRKKK